MKWFSENQRASITPPLRLYSSGAPRHLPYFRGGAEYQHFIFIELTLSSFILIFIFNLFNLDNLEANYDTASFYSISAAAQDDVD